MINVWRSLTEVHAAVLRDIETALAERHHLSLTEFDTLVNIPADGIRLRELKDRVILSQSAISRLCDRLQDRGLIIRTPVADDGRGALTELTPEGRKLVRAAARTNAGVVRQRFADRMSAEQLQMLGDIMDHLRTGGGEGCGPIQ